MEEVKVLDQNTDYTVAEMMQKALADESWEADPQMRAMYVYGLNNLLQGA